MPNITIQATDGSGSFSAYVAEPKNRPAGAVVLIQEIFGVNQAMRDAAAWVADLGFIAICPDLFWRIEPGVDITDQSEAEWKKAFELYNAFDVDAGVKDIAATVAFARTHAASSGKVGSVDNYVTFASDYGHQLEHWNGIDFSVNARPRGGVLLQGGFSTGRTSTDNCEIQAQLPEVSPHGRP